MIIGCQRRGSGDEKNQRSGGAPAMRRTREVKINTATTVTRKLRDCLVKYSNLFVRGVSIGN
jgi:hypothetical protein